MERARQGMMIAMMVQSLTRVRTQPSSLVGSALTSFFDIDFVGLPHLHYEPDKFTAATLSLTHR